MWRGKRVVGIELVGGDYTLVSSIKYNGLVRISDVFLGLFCYNHIMLVKIINVIISQCFQQFSFLCGMY
jgi:hypothetical protein